MQQADLLSAVFSEWLQNGLRSPYACFYIAQARSSDSPWNLHGVSVDTQVDRSLSISVSRGHQATCCYMLGSGVARVDCSIVEASIPHLVLGQAFFDGLFNRVSSTDKKRYRAS